MSEKTTPIVPAHVARRFSKAAGTYDAHAKLQRDVLLMAFEEAETRFAENAEILDLGCGTAAFARMAKERRPHWVVDGLDVAPGMIKMARPHCRHMIEAGMEHIPLPDGAYDYIFSSLALQWVGNQVQALREIARVLKPGGVAVITSFGQNTLRELRAVSHEVGLPSPVIAMHDALVYREWVKQAGLKTVLSKRREEVHRVKTLQDLFKQLRGIGATNQMQSRPRHFSSPTQFKAMVKLYTDHFGDALGISVSWDALLFVLKKPV